MKRKKILVFFIASLLMTGSLEARIYFLSPLSIQDRQPTEHQKIDQSVRFQFGVNGVSPTGADTDADFVSVPYQISYGLLEKLEVGALWGVHRVDRPNKSNQFGIMDLALGGRYRFFDANREERMPGLDMEAGLSFPTGSFEKGLGTGALGFIFGGALVLPLDPAKAVAGLGYRHNLENSEDLQVGGIFYYHGEVSFPFSVFRTGNTSLEQLTLLAELKGINHARNKKSGAKQGPTPDELYFAPGISWPASERISLAGSILIGLTTDSADIGMNLELQF